MDERLELDTARLRRVAAGLDAVSRALSAAALVTPAVEASGSHAVSHALQDFSDGWRRRRAALGADVEALRARTAEVADGFESTDHALARAVRSSGR
ncbi:hypothetical protein CLV35_0534 [Motilibacter peucedani]|uniref:Excreted virulence factor EspC (Type VII ESX diderm) n=1 Tax=Motilibacter peucedani TaxID=598650 RepID=A0A420XTF1_9ACTN|nr:hypothetical protein [Motilibacter peucedani]RKS80113.1 hypothetical protein CLV35_0534 [Motilibacter peucedani]